MRTNKSAAIVPIRIGTRRLFFGFSSTGFPESITYFDKKGNWLETETEITKEELTPAIIEVLNTQFFEYTIKDIELVETFDSQKLYEVDLQKDGKKYDILFDESGKILRKKI